MNISIVVLFLLFHSCYFQETNNIKVLVKSYEQNLNSSIQLEKDDRALMNSWASEFQLKIINVTTKNRMLATKQKDKLFERANVERSDLVTQWTECVYHHRRHIRKAYKQYIENESGCLTSTTVDDREKMADVKQVEKEIKKWRKGYRYLLNTCRNDNPGESDNVDACLVEYMEKDNYNNVIQRLIILKLEAMGKLYLHLDTSIKNLEECLMNQVATYLDKIKLIIESLNKCYEIRTKFSEDKTSVTI